MSHKDLHASGAFLERATVWWRAKHRSEPVKVFVKGDGYFRFSWNDESEHGNFSIPIETVLRETATP